VNKIETITREKFNLVDKIVEIFSPQRAFERIAYREALDLKRNYKAARDSRGSTGWHTSNANAEQADRPYRNTIRARARDLERNNAIAEGVVSAFVRNVVGTGFRVQAKVKNKNGTDNDKINNQIEKLWKKWCRPRNCDISGKKSFAKTQRLALHRKKYDGEALFLKVYDTTATVVPFKLQMLRPDMLDTSMISGNDGRQVVSGIEVDEYLKPVAYWLYKEDINGYTVTTQSTRIPADRIIHMFDQRDPTQVRGMSEIARVMSEIHDTGEYLEAERIKARIAACLCAVIETPDIGRFNRGRSASQETGQTEFEFSPGMVHQLLPGEKLSVVNPGNIPTSPEGYARAQQRIIGSGVGLSYEMVSRDSSQSTYSSARHALLEDRKTFEPMQNDMIDEFCYEVYTEFIISAVLSGALVIPDFWADKERYLEHKWITPGWAWIDPLKDVKASQNELEINVTTLEEKCAEQGKDWKEVVEQRAKEMAYLKENNLVPVVADGGVVVASQKK